MIIALVAGANGGCGVKDSLTTAGIIDKIGVVIVIFTDNSLVMSIACGDLLPATRRLIDSVTLNGYQGEFDCALAACDERQEGGLVEARADLLCEQSLAIGGSSQI